MRLCVYGGAFNPVHNGHLRAAVEAAEALALDRVDFVPTAAPPHRRTDNLLPFASRWHLLCQALSPFETFRVSEAELALEKPSYTLRTLTHYAGAYPKAELYFLLGAEDLLELPKWHRGRELAGLANLVVLPRDGAGLAEVEAFAPEFWPGAVRTGEHVFSVPDGKCLHYVPAPFLDIRATAVRRKVVSGRSVAGLVPRDVERALAAMAPRLAGIWP